jgi:hypothetical protein
MNITVSQLGWYLVAFWVAGIVLGWVQDWICDRFEFRVSRRGVRAARRWYGTAAHVCLRSAADDDDPDRFTVLARRDENTVVPWLLVHRLDPEYLTYWDEDAEAFWAKVTDFAPYAVRRVRPHFTRFGRVRVLWLTKWLPLSNPAGYLEGA